MLRQREFRLLWLGQACTGMGTWMDQVTRGWLIYELTNSAVQLGLVRGVQAIPFLLLSPIAGSAADRYSRKMQVVLAQVGNGLIYAATAVLIFTGQIRPWHVYVTAFLMAMVQVFQQPARGAMVSDAVPPENLTNAIGMNAVVLTSPEAPARLWPACSSPFSAPAARIRFKRFFSFWPLYGQSNSAPPTGSTPVARSFLAHGILWPEHHRRMQVQLEE